MEQERKKFSDEDAVEERKEGTSEAVTVGRELGSLVSETVGDAVYILDGLAERSILGITLDSG